jgi:predicted DNA-binding protein (UPF0251 family)
VTVDDTDIPRDVFHAIAEEVCTPAELAAVRLNEQMGYKRMALHLGLSISTVRGRLDRARAKVVREVHARRKATTIDSRGA